MADIHDRFMRTVSRRSFLRATAGTALAAASGRVAIGTAEPAAGEVLYNGIRLASPWPPNRAALPEVPTIPPYIADPPAIIPIDVGRQLFVDDFLIEESTLERTFHQAEYYAKNPILWPTTAWEKRDEYAERTKTRSSPSAMVFSDGVFYDAQDHLFKMWYMGGYLQNTCYAVSHDGLDWKRPSLDITPGTNIVTSGLRDSSTVWIDYAERDPAARYKMASFNGSEGALMMLVSADGLHWRQIGKSGPTGDRSTFFRNPFRNVWVFSIRDDIKGGMGRRRRYWETPDFFHGVGWKKGQPVIWAGADALDPRRPEYNVAPELYNLDCVAYESLLLGLFTIWRGERTEREKPNDVCVGFSRDGFHWDRSSRRAFVPVSEHVGDWNWANVQSAGGCCLVVGDKLYFYVSGRRGVPGSSDPGICSTGVAMLRRDGFASLAEPPPDAPVRRVWAAPHVPSSVTTRPIRFSGDHLFVNVDARGGELSAEILDVGGRVVSPFSRSNCRPIADDTTRAELTWTGGNMKELAGAPVRVRFYVVRALLYAFWVSRESRGASLGYVAAGGPGFTGPQDTVGAGARPAPAISA
jgi:hypothetical protein